MRMRRFFGTAAIFVLCLVGLSLPLSAQGVGGIGGTVVDQSGAVLPGVTVTLSNPLGSLGGNQTTVTDERGAFQFTRLVPGTYTVRGELSGFSPSTQEGIVVNADFNARVDMRLQIGALEEGIVVSGQSPLLDTPPPMRQTVLSREVLNALPNRVDVWSVARVIPGVILSKVDVGGSESFLQSAASVHGTSSENGFLIDGMDVSALDGNGTVAAMYLDPYAFEETNYQAGGAGSAVAQKGGLLFNMVTRTGTNKFHGGGMFNGAGHSMGFTNLSADMKSQLLAAVPPVVLAANPNIVPGADILKIYDTGAWLAGPIKQDKLWFSYSFHDQALDQYLLGNYNPDGTQVLDDNLMWTMATKVAWQMTPSTQVSYFNNLQYKLIGHRNGGGTFAESRARNLNDKYPDVHQAKFTSTLSNRAVIDVSYSRFRADDKFGQEPEVNDGDISRFDSITNSYVVALPTYRDNAMHRDGLYTNMDIVSGSHDVRFGFQYIKGGEKSSAWSTSGMRAVYRSGVPDSVNTYNVPITSTDSRIPVAFELWDRDMGIYVQDKWMATRKLTINAGVRFESNFGWQPAGCRAANTFVAETCWGQIEGNPDFKNVVPRFSAIYDLKGDGRTAIKFAASRYDQPINISINQRLNPVGTTSDSRPWTACTAGTTSGCDLNGDHTPQLNELGVSTGFTFGTTNRYDPDLKWPVSNEYSLELQRQLFANTVMTVGYTNRQTRRNIGFKNMAVPIETYIPLQVTEVNSGKQVTVYNQAPALRGRVDNLYFNTDTANSDYNGGDVTIAKRMSNKWALNGGASFGKTLGDTLSQDLNNPNSAQFRRGLLGNDSPWSYRMSGVYQAPRDIFLSGTWQYYQGFPETTTVSVANNTVALTQGTTTLTVEPRGTTRLPPVASFDFSVRKTFRVQQWRFEPRIDLYNMTNQASIIGQIAQLGPTYGRISNVQRGALIKIGLSGEFKGRQERQEGRDKKKRKERRGQRGAP